MASFEFKFKMQVSDRVSSLVLENEKLDKKLANARRALDDTSKEKVRLEMDTEKAKAECRQIKQRLKEQAKAECREIKQRFQEKVTIIVEF